MPEDTVGIYILQRQIAKGGMGAVFLAHDPTLDRPVAKEPEERYPTTRRLVSIDPKKDAVPIQREDGTIERVAYRSVLRIETLGGR